MADAGLLRQENTALLRRAMQDGVFSKNELARQTGLSFPTVGRIIDDMVERGEAREAGVAASTGGRCAMRYELDMHYRLFLCLRLEQDTLHWLCAASTACRSSREKRPVRAMCANCWTRF